MSKFGSDRNRPYGKTTNCKECRNKNAKEWRMRNLEKGREIGRRCYARKKEAEVQEWKLKCGIK